MANCPDVAYTALGPMRQTVLSIATHGFIGCYGNLSGTDMESLRCRSEPGVMHQSPPPWHCRFRTSLFHHNSWFLWLWLDALLKSFCTSHWVGPRKNASNRAPHLLRPALFRQSGLFFALWEQRCRNICARIFQDFAGFSGILPETEPWYYTKLQFRMVFQNQLLSGFGVSTLSTPSKNWEFAQIGCSQSDWGYLFQVRLTYTLACSSQETTSFCCSYTEWKRFLMCWKGLHLMVFL